MPNVSEDFVKCAHRLATEAMQRADNEKKASDKSAELKTAAEMVAETLVEQQLVPATQKSAAVKQLMDHGTALQVLNKTAQVRYAASVPAAAPSMGKAASAGGQDNRTDYRGETMSDADVHLFQSLGLM